MQRREYCVITGVDTGVNGLYGNYPRLAFFGPGGLGNTVDLGNRGRRMRPRGMETLSESDYIAAVIAQLGGEGWQMVSAVNGSSTEGTGTHCIYFRRPIP